MKLTFLGAAHEVTGSCTLLEADGKKILIDCGMEQGKDTFVNQELPVSAGEIDLVLLTHAHIDHSGKIPLLVKQGFSGSIYTTEATSDLCRIMLMDSAHIQESEAAWRSKKAARAGKEPVEPLYDTMDAQRALSLLRPCAYGEKIRVSEGIDATSIWALWKVRTGNSMSLSSTLPMCSSPKIPRKTTTICRIPSLRSSTQ